MRTIPFLLSILFLILPSPSFSQTAGPQVMARHVPERLDDIVFENDLVCFRIYGKALENNTTSPGFDVWVKLPGKLVADDWYAHAQKEPGYYHHNHGGKDCYKVSTSLGAGASAVIMDGKICYPATNYRTFEILEKTDRKVVFILHYPQWSIGAVKLSLDKKITVTPGTYLLKCEDVYTFSGAETLQVGAGVFRHDSGTIENEYIGNGTYAIWEHASDQSAEPEVGMIGVAVKLPRGRMVSITSDGSHGLCPRTVRSGETYTYYFGACWSKAGIDSADQWFNIVKKFKCQK